MKTQNKAQLIGYLGADPKIFQTTSGDQYAIMRMATDHHIREKDTTRKITSWHVVKLWGKERMDFVKNNLLKGSHILVDGMIDYYTVLDKSGNKQYKTEIKAVNIMNLDR